jgi:hypothetical protein
MRSSGKHGHSHRTEYFWVLSRGYLEKSHRRTQFGRQPRQKSYEAQAKHIAPAEGSESYCGENHSGCIVLFAESAFLKTTLSSPSTLIAGFAGRAEARSLSASLNAALKGRST